MAYGRQAGRTRNQLTVVVVVMGNEPEKAMSVVVSRAFRHQWKNGNCR